VDCPDCGAKASHGCWCGYLLPGGYCEARILRAAGAKVVPSKRPEHRESAPPSQRDSSLRDRHGRPVVKWGPSHLVDACAGLFTAYSTSTRETELP
jgi:hypothetical protein